MAHKSTSNKARKLFAWGFTAFWWEFRKRKIPIAKHFLGDRVPAARSGYEAAWVLQDLKNTRLLAV